MAKLLLLACATDALLSSPRLAARPRTSLEHHKKRSAVEDLKIYRKMKSWETKEEVVDTEAADEFARELAAYVPSVTTYGETRNGNAVSLPLPAAFGGVGAAIAAASVALHGGAGVGVEFAFAMPFLLGAGIFALNKLDPVETTYDGDARALSAKFEALATPTMRTVLADVTTPRYFEDAHLTEALTELRLAGLGNDAPVLRRVELFDDGDDDVSLSLVFHAPEVPFKEWIVLARKGRLDSFFDGASCSVSKISQAERLVSIDISTAEDVFEEETPAVIEHSHSHDHDHAPDAVDGHAHSPSEAATEEVFAR